MHTRRARGRAAVRGLPALNVVRDRIGLPRRTAAGLLAYLVAGLAGFQVAVIAGLDAGSRELAAAALFGTACAIGAAIVALSAARAVPPAARWFADPVAHLAALAIAVAAPVAVFVTLEPGLDRRMARFAAVALASALALAVGALPLAWSLRRAAIADRAGTWRTALPKLAPAAGFVAVTVAGIAVRQRYLPHRSSDYVVYVEPWFNYIRLHGITGAMGDNFSNYTPPYLYLLGLAIRLPFQAITAVKSISIAFDVVLAGGIGLLAWQRWRNAWLALAAYACVLGCPTVILNSSEWGQCDSVFTAFLVLGVYFAASRRPSLGMLMFGIAFAFKLQAIFVLPLFAVFTVRRAMPLAAWLLFPLPYLVAILPSWVLGRPLDELLTIYWDQSQLATGLTFNAPNLYQWLDQWESMSNLGVLLAGAACLAVIAACWRYRLELDANAVLLLALLFSLLIPFLLPRMHERYFYPADVLSIAYAFVFPRRAFLPLLVVPASLFAYWPFLYDDRTPVAFDRLALLIAAALLVVLWDFVRILRREPAPSPSPFESAALETTV